MYSTIGGVLMPRRIIGEEVAAKALRLHRQGLSYRTIGTALDIDPRTAKKRVQRLTAEEQADHWKGVEQMVDAKYVDEHYQLLLHTSSGVHRALETHFRNSAASAEVLLNYHVGVALEQSRKGRGEGCGRRSAQARSRIREARPTTLTRALVSARRLCSDALTCRRKPESAQAAKAASS